MPTQRSGTYARVLIGSDLHGPYLDRRAYRCFLAAASAVPWDLCVLNGDVCDFSQISRHDRQVGSYKREHQEEVGLADELDFVRTGILAPLRKALGKTPVTMRLGNHETRWLAASEAKPQVLAELLRAMRRANSLHLEDVLGLKDYGVKLSYNAVDRLHGSFTLIHGVKSTIGAARANLLRYGSGASGHSHRMNCFTQVMHGKPQGWWESGCLRTVDEVEYLPLGDKPDWSQGFLSLTIDRRTGHFFCTPHFIIDGRCEVRGQILKG